MKYPLCLLTLIGLTLPGCVTAPPTPETAPRSGTAELTVAFTGVSSDAGRVAFAIFDDEPSFATGEAAVETGFLPIEDGSARLTVRLPYGQYAVKAYQDSNGNGELDRGPLGVPAEPYGFSNDARGRFGPPSYGKARFALTAPRLRIAIELR